jgi:hypothetical protein
MIDYVHYSVPFLVVVLFYVLFRAAKALINSDEAPALIDTPCPSPETTSAAERMGLSQPKKPVEEMTENEAREALEKALNDMFGGSMKLEFFPDSGSGQVVPFTEIENYNDAKKELLHHEEMYDMLTNEDLIEELLSYYHKGYEFEGLIEIYDKLQKQIDLTKDDRKKLEQWYVLVGMELVYNV